jgi:hypothetical protein
LYIVVVAVDDALLKESVAELKAQFAGQQVRCGGWVGWVECPGIGTFFSNILFGVSSLDPIPSLPTTSTNPTYKYKTVPHQHIDRSPFPHNVLNENDSSARWA